MEGEDYPVLDRGTFGRHRGICDDGAAKGAVPRGGFKPDFQEIRHRSA